MPRALCWSAAGKPVSACRPGIPRATPDCISTAPQRVRRQCAKRLAAQRPSSTLRTACTARSDNGAEVLHGDDLEDDFEGLVEEDDYQVPGAATDSLSSNTQLGRAVQSACSELEQLSSLERQAQEEAQALLKSLGYKGDLFRRPDDADEGQA